MLKLESVRITLSLKTLHGQWKMVETESVSVFVGSGNRPNLLQRECYGQL